MRLIVVLVALALLVSLIGAPALAKKKRKKGPAPYKSPEATIVAGHVTAFNSLGTPASLTIKEFEASCSIPASNGADAFVYEVPDAYRDREAGLRAFGSGGMLGYDLDLFVYDESCAMVAASSTAAADEFGFLPKGSAYVIVQNYGATYLDADVTVHYELEPA